MAESVNSQSLSAVTEGHDGGSITHSATTTSTTTNQAVKSKRARSQQTKNKQKSAQFPNKQQQQPTCSKSKTSNHQLHSHLSAFGGITTPPTAVSNSNSNSRKRQSTSRSNVSFNASTSSAVVSPITPPPSINTRTERKRHFVDQAAQSHSQTSINCKYLLVKTKCI